MQLSTVVNLRPRGIPPLPEALQVNSLGGYILQGELSSAGPGTGDTLDITDQWSFACWARMEEASGFGQRHLFSLRGTSGFANEFRIGTTFRSPAGSLNNMRIQLTDAAEATVQDVTWTGVIDAGTETWHHYVWTWNGTDDANSSKLYVDGVDQVSVKSASTNLGSAMTDTSRDILIGGDFTGLNATWPGPVYSCGLYNTVLSSAEVSVLYNGGNARDIDPLQNFQAYQSSGNLQHYYRPGIEADDTVFGLDLGVGTNKVNLANNNLTLGMQTEEIPQATGHFQGFSGNTIVRMQKDSATLGVTDEFTLQMWLRRTGTSFSRGIFDSAGANTVDNRRLLQHNSTSELQYELRGPAGSSMASLVLSYEIPDLPVSSTSVEWEHFVFVYDGTNASDNDLFIYYNGVELTTGAKSGVGDPYIVKVNDGNPNQTDTSVDTAVGGSVDSGFGSMWQGMIYGVAIWNDVLTSAEIVALYASGSPKDLTLTSDFGNYVSSADLRHWWNWEDASDRGKDLGSLSRNLGDDALGSPEFTTRTFWNLAEYPGSPGNSTT